MQFSSEKALKEKIHRFFLDIGYAVAVQPTLGVENIPLVVDLLARKDDVILLIEINNGVRVGMNNIAQLIKYSKELQKKRGVKVYELIITDKMDKIDPEVSKITTKRNIKVLTYDSLVQEGLSLN